MKPQVIMASDFDPNFKWEVLSHPSAGQVTACFSCGTCTVGCPIHDVFPGYDPRKIARMINLGMKESLLSNPCIWYCATCHNCEEFCPQDVKFFNVLNVVKNIAAREGYAPASWVNQTRQVMKTGIVFPTEEAWVKKREELSLPPLSGKGEKAATLLRSIGVDRLQPGGSK